MLVRRWFCAGSARVTFKRLRSLSDCGAFLGGGGGVTFGGSFPDTVWESAMVL